MGVKGIIFALGTAHARNIWVYQLTAGWHHCSLVPIYLIYTRRPLAQLRARRQLGVKSLWFINGTLNIMELIISGAGLVGIVQKGVPFQWDQNVLWSLGSSGYNKIANFGHEITSTNDANTVVQSHATRYRSWIRMNTEHSANIAFMLGVQSLLRPVFRHSLAFRTNIHQPSVLMIKTRHSKGWHPPSTRQRCTCQFWMRMWTMPFISQHSKPFKLALRSTLH